MRLSFPTFDEAKARAISWLTAWDSQGFHRAGTTADEAGALWLAPEAASLGAEVTTEIFELDRLDPVACYLELDGERISAVPAFDAPATSANGVTGTLSLSNHNQAILVTKLAPQSVYTGLYERLRRRAAHRALVIICVGARAGIGMLNAERFRHPYGAPTIHVSSEVSEFVLAYAGRAAPARVVAQNQHVPATADKRASPNSPSYRSPRGQRMALMTGSRSRSCPHFRKLDLMRDAVEKQRIPAGVRIHEGIGNSTSTV